ncbi:hypothetical protein FB557_0853 [Marihabitans asiaticum]|uniref:Uncharacterized protein n=2 Tax=Marihabitans asiaticum TaxID=415218 RepID=A0A560WI79_9MICO|nr:hypothetical protein FB557_0853 [Marihabitans asiaticum]
MGQVRESAMCATDEASRLVAFVLDREVLIAPTFTRECGADASYSTDELTGQRIVDPASGAGADLIALSLQSGALPTAMEVRPRRDALAQ